MKNFREIRQLLLEVSEGDARKYMKKTLEKLGLATELEEEYGPNWSEVVFNKIRTDFVHSGCSVYFVPGLARILYSELDYDSDDEDTNKIQRLRQLVKFITTAHKSQFSRNLEHITVVQQGPNKGQQVRSAPFSFDDLYNMFNREQEKITNDERTNYEKTSQNSTKYTVIELNNFETAHKYYQYTNLPGGDSWCYLENEDTFDSYRDSGNKLYLALAPGFEKLKPGDKGYGRSMIGFDMGPIDNNGRSTLEVCNNRYNHAQDLEHENDKSGDNKYNEIELSKILGVPVWSTYRGYSKEELIKRGIISLSIIQETAKAITPEQIKSCLADKTNTQVAQCANTLYIAIDSQTLLSVLKDNLVFSSILSKIDAVRYDRSDNEMHYTLHLLTDTSLNVITAFVNSLSPTLAISRAKMLNNITNSNKVTFMNNCVVFFIQDFETDNYDSTYDIILPDCTLLSSTLQRHQSIYNFHQLPTTRAVLVGIHDNNATTMMMLNTVTGESMLNSENTPIIHYDQSTIYNLFVTTDNTYYVFTTDNTADNDDEKINSMKFYSSFKLNHVLSTPEIFENDTAKYAYIVATPKNAKYKAMYTLDGKMIISPEMHICNLYTDKDLLYYNTDSAKMVASFANPTKFIAQTAKDMFLKTLSWYSEYYDKEVDAIYGNLNIIISALPDETYKINVFSAKLQAYIFNDIISSEAYLIHSYDDTKHMYFFRIFLNSTNAALAFMNSSYGMLPCLVKLTYNKDINDFELSDEILEWAKLPEEIEAEQNEAQQK